MDLSPAIAREARKATPVASLGRFAITGRNSAPARAYGELCHAPRATGDHALEQLLPALETSEAPA